MFKRYLCAITVCGLVLSGCGYTTRSMLSSEHKSIYVDSFVNKIKITAEQSDARMYRGYRPGLETDITKAVIDRYLFDGNLRLASQKGADLALTGSLVDFRKEPLRYDTNDNIEEYRIIVVVDMELTDVKTGKIMWHENAFSGEATYRTGGSFAKSEGAAMSDALSDLARRIVERTVEGW